MIHTGLMPFSKPILLYTKAREYPEVTIIVAHAGEQFLQNEAIILAIDCSNVILETSVHEANSRTIRQLVKRIGARRVMNGSGWPTEMEHSVWKYRHREKGGDIDAACGQLRLKTERELERRGS